MSDKIKLLIVDDERNSREVIARFLKKKYEIAVAEDGLQAIKILQQRRFDLVLSDIRMPGADGMQLLEALQSLERPPLAVMMTAYGNIDDAIKATKSGAFYYITKPIDIKNLELLLERAVESTALKHENIELKKQLSKKSAATGIISQSKAMRQILETVEQVAPARTTVLITGESGTGKELIAEALHNQSGREGSFVPVHCAALPANLLESELFGHEKGAFTGAVEQRPGRFELANNGTIFLDEIGEIEPQVQVKLLRALEARSFERIGGVETIHSTARVVAATNKNLQQMVADGTFREDLFYRLNVITVELPPLRRRAEDIPLLVKHFLDLYSNESARGALSICEDALDLLARYSWPGNIRELRNCIERMSVLSRNEVLQVEDVPLNIRDESSFNAVLSNRYDLSIDNHEKTLIIKALEETGGNKTKAADKLGISRRTLHRKLNTYNIS